MSIAKILVPLSGSQKDQVSLETAFALAKRVHAFVDAVFVHPDVREAMPMSDMPISPEIMQSIIDAADAAKKAAANAARWSWWCPPVGLSPCRRSHRQSPPASECCRGAPAPPQSAW